MQKARKVGTITTRLEIPILWSRTARVLLEDTTYVNIMNHYFALPGDLTSRPEYATVFIRLCPNPFTETLFL
jgi:hypothetical protein